MKLLDFDDKKAVKKRQVMFKPKPKAKPMKYTHSFKKLVPMDVKKQIYELYHENELTVQQITDKFGLAYQTTVYIIKSYPRQAGITTELPRREDRIYSLELRVNRIERELNI